jgi:dTDP-4-dehydrorhamnose 3,5-epimerase
LLEKNLLYTNRNNRNNRNNRINRLNRINPTMPFIETPIPDLLVFEPRVHYDDRGYFFESYNSRVWAEAGVDTVFVQDNQARSTRGVLRGLHFQTGEMAQAKLVRVIEGEVLDVVVDLRPDSPTHGQWYGIRLSADNKRQMLVPRGFAHGYVVRQLLFQSPRGWPALRRPHAQH